MKIIVGCGYNERDEWINDLVFRLITSFGDEPASGTMEWEHDLELYYD